MREARQTAEGRWYIVEGNEVCRIGPADWHPDPRGHWPRVELEARALNEAITCPACGTTWILEEFDCVFGTACRAENDLLVLVRCVTCRLPHRVRAVGFFTAYPGTVELMEGWAAWDKRRNRFQGEEQSLYGESGNEEPT